MTPRFSIPCLVLCVAVAALIGFYAGRLVEARALNAEITADFSRPLEHAGQTPAPLARSSNF